MAATPTGRSGTVVCHRSADRWTADVRLVDRTNDETHEYTVSLNRTLPSEELARRAGEQLLTDWTTGDALLRDLLLKELAAAYRTLRQTFKTMQPPTVPATRSAWDRAIDTWEQRGWIQAPDAQRYREHVQCAFEAVAAAVRRHRLAVDAGPDSTS